MAEVYIHPTAHVDKTAKIGPDTKVWINAQIREGVVIGGDCSISKDTYIDKDVQIGNNCRIQNGVSIYTGVTLEDDILVGPNVSFTNHRVPRVFMENWTIDKTLICTGVSLGSNSTIICGVVIGEYAMVAAGSVVTKDVDPYTLVMGNPAMPYAKINREGEVIELIDQGKSNG